MWAAFSWFFMRSCCSIFHQAIKSKKCLVQISDAIIDLLGHLTYSYIKTLGCFTHLLIRNLSNKFFFNFVIFFKYVITINSNETWCHSLKVVMIIINIFLFKSPSFGLALPHLVCYPSAQPSPHLVPRLHLTLQLSSWPSPCTFASSHALLLPQIPLAANFIYNFNFF